MKSLLTIMLICLLTGCPGVPKHQLRVSLASLSPVKATLFEQSFDLVLRIQNPNDQPLSAKGIDFKLVINDTVLGRGVSNQSIEVPAYGEAEITISMRTTLLDWINQMQGKTLKDKQVNYQLEGHLQGLNGWGTLPFNKQGKLTF